ncbi:MAG: major capsid protein [Opitutaceae bacterium]
MFTDFILNGQGHGDVAQMLGNCRFDPGLLRPYVDDNGRKCATVNTGRMAFNEKTGMYAPVYENCLISNLMENGIFSPVFNATSLRKQEWIELDRVVLRAARQRLKAWSDLAAANTFGGFNGMAKMILEHETMSDPGEAVVDMDGLTEGRTDSPKYQLEGLPLPITHSDFQFSSRRMAVSRNSGTPLDTTMAEAAGRRVAEMIEKTLIGVETGVTYGKASDYSNAPTVFGYTNHPDRVIKTDVTVPTGANPDKTVTDFLAIIKLMADKKFYGPFMVYHSPDWAQYLDNDYYVLSTSGATAPTQTLRQRLRAIEGIQDVRQLDFLSDTFTLIFVQMTSDVARAVNGMDITTVQWESKGGMQLNFKVMAIQVPQLRSDYNGNCGICHATTA